VGIAQLLMRKPSILIFDEPTAGLDIEERIRFRNLLKNLGLEHTVIISSHIVEDIEFLWTKDRCFKKRKRPIRRNASRAESPCGKICIGISCLAE